MAEAAAKKKTLLEEFMAGCKKGFYIGAENIMPAMVLAYSLILFLNITGLMDIIAAQATILFPATITMGTLVGHFARCVLTSGANPKHHALLLAIPVIDALLSMIIVRVILNFMGISC